MTLSAMYKPKILIVKTSSLGDIIQAFYVLGPLRDLFPEGEIHWVVESRFASMVSSHPLIDRTISLDIGRKKNLWDSMQTLRRECYDFVFDLQGNCKSGLITACCRGKVKIGYDLFTAREWPNVLATHIRFHISKKQNIRFYYLELIQRYFNKRFEKKIEAVELRGSGDEKKVAQLLLSSVPGFRILVCPGSKWSNKQLKKETWIHFLQKIEKSYDVFFLFSWGSEEEKVLCESIAKELQRASLVEKLSFSTWQNLMHRVDLVMAVDSSALHLCGTTQTPSFSIFGPTSSDAFKPIGAKHIAFQGVCPYGRVFDKQCPILRNCPTGACVREINPDNLFKCFQLHKIIPDITGRIDV